MNQLLNKPFIQTLQSFGATDNIGVDVLRLDAIHPVVSGNKWYKLQYYLQDAVEKKCNTIVTFGGAYSNHIVATAFACKQMNLRSIGIVRGEEAPTLSHTLQQAKNYGMELQFVSREAYKNKAAILAQFNDSNVYSIVEGGYGELGAKGASTILSIVDTANYTHIICACGTGTMLAGLVQSALPHQQVIGINVLKGYEKMYDDVCKILSNDNKHHPFTILNQYHFGGYAKHTKQLIDWMNELFIKENLPTDIVYTSKLFYAVNDLLQQQYFAANSKLLVIHSGGLQGNFSLENGVLLF